MNDDRIYNLYIVKFSNFKNVDFKLFFSTRDKTLTRFREISCQFAHFAKNLKAKEEEKDPPRGPLSKQSTRCRGRDTLSRTFKTGGGESVAEKREEIREEERSSLCLCTGCFEQLIQPLWRNNRLAKCSPAAACCYTPSAEANSLQRRPQTTKVLGEVVRN